MSHVRCARSAFLYGSQIIDVVETLTSSVMQQRVESERLGSSLLSDVKSISDNFFVLDDLLNKVFKYRKKEAVSQHPGTLSQQEIDDVQPFRDWMESMQLQQFSIEFEKRKYADLDTLVLIGVDQVYHMTKTITAMSDEQIALFMLNFSNIVFMQRRDEDDSSIHQTLE